MAKTLFKGFSTVQGPKTRKLHDIELAKQDLINHFHTKKGERVMSPGFGSMIWKLMFEPWNDTTEEAVKEDCINIVANDPRWRLEGVSTYSNNNALSVQLRLFYQPTDQLEVMALTFDRELEEGI
jgi:phage baseplate assembly protein W|tara:strand:+ start:1412 stop:1786 length:375 start_codon:yes stop_codon:yes gene_type:complete